MSLGVSPITASDLPEMVERGTLRVIAGAGEQPEMFSFDPDQPPGFEREMLEGFARLHRIELEVVVVKAFSDRIPALLKGTGDVCMGMIVTPERARKISFTTEVLPARHLVVNHAPRAPIESVEQFRKEKVGVVTATTWAKAAVEAGVPESKAKGFKDTEPMLRALEAGSITATTMSISDFTLAAKRRPGLQAGVFVGAAGSAAWGVRQGDTKLKAAFDEYLINMRRGPSWNRLVVKYFGEKALSVLGRSDN